MGSSNTFAIGAAGATPMPAAVVRPSRTGGWLVVASAAAPLRGKGLPAAGTVLVARERGADVPPHANGSSGTPVTGGYAERTTTSTIPITEVSGASGRWASISNSCSSSAASWTEERPWVTTWLIAVPPSAVIHSVETSEGISSTATRNSRTVRPRLTRAMNMPTKGDQLIHQAQ